MAEVEGGVIPFVSLGVELGVEDAGVGGMASLDGMGFVGTGATIAGVFCGAGPARFDFFMAASLAETSARFCMMRSLADS